MIKASNTPSQNTNLVCTSCPEACMYKCGFSCFLEEKSDRKLYVDLAITGVMSVTIMSHCLHLKFLCQLTHLLYTTWLSVLPYRVPETWRYFEIQTHEKDIRTSPGRGEWRQKVQSAGLTDMGRLDPHPGPANRSTAATLAKCIP